MPSAYIETTIPSYYVARPSMSLIQASRQASTQAWWDTGCSGFDLFTCSEVIEEAGIGDPELAQRRLQLLASIPRLELNEAVGLVAETLLKNGLIPPKAASDAIHIGVASVHQIDYLITWNFKHIANPFIRSRLRRLIEESGFHLPVICTPEELIPYDEDR